MTRSSFQSVERKTKPLDIVHVERFDLKATPTQGGNKYFIAFINDCSKYFHV